MLSLYVTLMTAARADAPSNVSSAMPGVLQ
jgi:hypothetical protein